MKSKNKCSFIFTSVVACTVTVGLGSKLGVRHLVTSILEISPVWMEDFGHLLTAGLQNAHKFLGAMKVPNCDIFSINPFVEFTTK